jgi:ribulose 1,5-bisphosphate carboxylase large subunit-like protein
MSSSFQIDTNQYIIAKYEVQAKNLLIAAKAIAIGQSIGNPYIRNGYENAAIYKKHGCVILDDEKELEQKNKGTISIGFPIANLNLYEEGISHLLCQLMGGHTDIDEIKRCSLVDVKFPKKLLSFFNKPKSGITGIRKFTGRYDKPLAGSIIKPKIGFTKKQYTDLINLLIDSEIDFVKEDEIISNPAYFPLEKRVELAANLLAKKNHKMVFCHTVNCDPHKLLEKVKLVYELGGNGIHTNVFSGLGAYNSIRQLDLPLFLHMQTSGAKLFSHPKNKFHISWQVVCYIASLVGVDTIQVGMIGGYSNDDSKRIMECIDILRKNNTLPALSCGLHPGLIDYLRKQIGVDFIANSGGCVHGHTGGTKSGARALRQAIDNDYGPEYHEAIRLWGKR